ncbi:MAG: 2-oxo-hepta-3-ene-1,7-dioate hydratase [Alphaproteobacteria bacterium]|nr:2-oxo-hepta-3-ene-1,7-dioate hydratase [Alphaproteobacteria bacterium]
MMTPQERAEAARQLLEAERTRKPVVQLSKTFPHITIEDAYAIQNLVTEAKIKAGGKVRGHKVGLTSKAMQQSSQIDEPDYGHLMADMFHDDGVKLKHADFCVPRVEMELGFVLGKPLKGPGVGLLDMAATEWVVPCIEVIDARVQNPRKIFDTVSDNGAAAAVILGGRPIRPTDVDLRWVSGLMYRNEGIEESGVAASVLGHPALGISWLANKVGSFGGSLEAGHFVLSGSFIRPVWAEKGDTLRADFGPLGSIGVMFV